MFIIEALLCPTIYCLSVIYNEMMNSSHFQKSKQLQQKAKRYISSILRNMGWSFQLPPYLLNIILSYLYFSFLRHPSLFIISPHRAIDKCQQFIVQSGENIRKIYVDEPWHSLQDQRIDYLQQYKDQFINFLQGRRTNSIKGKPKECLYFGRECDMHILNKLMKKNFKGRGLLGMEVWQWMKKLMNRHILTFLCQDKLYFVIEDENKMAVLANSLPFRYDRIQKKWVIDGDHTLWRKSKILTRKGQLIRISTTELYNYNNGFFEEIPQDYHYPKQTSIKFVIQ